MLKNYKYQGSEYYIIIIIRKDKLFNLYNPDKRILITIYQLTVHTIKI